MEGKLSRCDTSALGSLVLLSPTWRAWASCLPPLDSANQEAECPTTLQALCRTPAGPPQEPCNMHCCSQQGTLHCKVSVTQAGCTAVLAEGSLSCAASCGRLCLPLQGHCPHAVSGGGGSCLLVLTDLLLLALQGRVTQHAKGSQQSQPCP